MPWETRVQSQVKSYQRLKKWYLMLPCFTISIIRYISRVKWSNEGKGVAPSPTPWSSSYWKGGLQVALDYSHQLYFTEWSSNIYIYIYIYIYIKFRQFLWVLCKLNMITWWLYFLNYKYARQSFSLYLSLLFISLYKIPVLNHITYLNAFFGLLFLFSCHYA